jgi:radical SAM superfamily enzyme YgiQ (UPF0313 family)
MKVTFVGIGSEQLAISLLSAVLREQGHTTSLVFHPALFDYDGFLDVAPLASLLDRTDRLVDEIVELEPDLVAFSVLTAAYQWSLRVARAVKARMDVPVIFGGVHPSAVPDVCLENPCVDYVCVGEGEEALVRLCEALPSAGGRPAEPIANLRWRDGERIVVGPAAGFIQDLDALPMWDKEIWGDNVRIADNWMTMSSRGCPYRCTFCFNNFFANLPGKGGGKYLRQRSIDSMMAELLHAKQEFGIRRVDFEDDIFTTHKSWIRDFMAEYRREIDLPFQCLVHPRFLDEDIARWLKDAGCQHVQMGVQSVDEEYKREELRRTENDAQLHTALAALDAAHLDLKLDHILGLPGEPLAAQELAREIYAEFPPRRIQTFWLVHLPGVELTERAVERGELSREDYDAINRGTVQRYHAAGSDWMGEGPEYRYYRRYELLFRLMSVVPRPLARRLRIRHIPDLPLSVNRFVGLVLEGANAVIHRDDETRNYLRSYARHLAKFVGLRRRTTAVARPPSRRAEVHRLPVTPSAPAEDDCGTPQPVGAVAVTLGRRAQ